MQHSMKLLEGPFEKMKLGLKTIEIRLFDHKRQELQIGDTVEFSKLPDLNEKLTVEVIGLLRYKSFRDLLDNYDMEYFGYPKDHPKDEFIESIYTIYTKEDEEKYGVLGIQVKIL